MSFGYGGQPEVDSIATLRRAVEIGVTFLRSAIPDQGERSKYVPDGARVPRQMFRNPEPCHFHLFGYVIQ